MLFSLLLSTLTSIGQQVVNDVANKGTSVEARFQVKSSHTQLLTDGTRRLVTMQRVKPLVIPPPPVVAISAPSDPVVVAARRAAWAQQAKKTRRFLSLTGVSYPNGQTFLQWFMPGPDGKWTTYEAWTLTDLRAASLVSHFEVKDTLYDLFPHIQPASKFDLRRDFPGPLWFPAGGLAFRLTKGDPTHLQSMEPIAALLEIMKNEGPALTTQWLSRKAAQDAETARLIANPPPVEDIVISLTVLKSNLAPEAESEATAAKAEGFRLAKP